VGVGVQQGPTKHEAGGCAGREAGAHLLGGRCGVVGVALRAADAELGVVELQVAAVDEAHEVDAHLGQVVLRGFLGGGWEAGAFR
jgi:hypothetical protein